MLTNCSLLVQSANNSGFEYYVHHAPADCVQFNEANVSWHGMLRWRPHKTKYLCFENRRLRRLQCKVGPHHQPYRAICADSHSHSHFHFNLRSNTTSVRGWWNKHISSQPISICANMRKRNPARTCYATLRFWTYLRLPKTNCTAPIHGKFFALSSDGYSWCLEPHKHVQNYRFKPMRTIKQVHARPHPVWSRDNKPESQQLVVFCPLSRKNSNPCSFLLRGCCCRLVR